MSPHPFRFTVDTPVGPVQVDVLPGRLACVSGPSGPGPAPGFPLAMRGRAFDLRARYARGPRGWQVRDLSVQARDPADAPGHVEVALALGPALARALEGELRRFVERDLVEVHRERREEAEAMGRVRAEIERRRAKLEGMARSSERAECGRAAREEALRAELADLPAAPSAVPSAGPAPAEAEPAAAPSP